jgi:hypothetical protein
VPVIGPGDADRQIRALFTTDTITVYQAYSPEIAGSALAAGRFIAPFKRDRMTWVKPSFLWMMYRSGWATKPGQERILAIEITRIGFEWALAHAALSHFHPDVHAAPADWRATQHQPVRIQWDPDRDLRLQPTSRRAIQIGLGGDAVDHYVDDWTVGIRDLTDLALTIRDQVEAGTEQDAVALLPPERPYALAPDLKHRIGATG